jgi:hypothetical protein
MYYVYAFVGLSLAWIAWKEFTRKKPGGKGPRSSLRRDAPFSVAEALAADDEMAVLPDAPRYNVKVVGASMYQQDLERLAGGRSEGGVSVEVLATVVPEPSNPHDRLAMRVDVSGRTVGYLSREDARSYRKRLKAEGLKVEPMGFPGLIVGGWDRGKDDRGHFGLRLDLAQDD